MYFRNTYIGDRGLYIASISTEMSMQSSQNAISMNVLSKAMNHDEMSMTFITGTLEKTYPVESVSSFGHIFNVRT